MLRLSSRAPVVCSSYPTGHAVSFSCLTGKGWNAFVVLLCDESGRFSFISPLIPECTTISQAEFAVLQLTKSLYKARSSQGDLDKALSNFLPSNDGSTLVYESLTEIQAEVVDLRCLNSGHRSVCVGVISYPFRFYDFTFLFRLYADGVIEMLVGFIDFVPFSCNKSVSYDFIASRFSSNNSVSVDSTKCVTFNFSCKECYLRIDQFLYALDCKPLDIVNSFRDNEQSSKFLFVAEQFFKSDLQFNVLSSSIVQGFVLTNHEFVLVFAGKSFSRISLGKLAPHALTNDFSITTAPLEAFLHNEYRGVFKEFQDLLDADKYSEFAWNDAFHRFQKVSSDTVSLKQSDIKELTIPQAPVPRIVDIMTAKVETENDIFNSDYSERLERVIMLVCQY